MSQGITVLQCNHGNRCPSRMLLCNHSNHCILSVAMVTAASSSVTMVTTVSSTVTVTSTVSRSVMTVEFSPETTRSWLAVSEQTHSWLVGRGTAGQCSRWSITPQYQVKSLQFSFQKLRICFSSFSSEEVSGSQDKHEHHQWRILGKVWFKVLHFTPRGT